MRWRLGIGAACEARDVGAGATREGERGGEARVRGPRVSTGPGARFLTAALACTYDGFQLRTLGSAKSLTSATTRRLPVDV
jgi:hypothetical protein